MEPLTGIVGIVVCATDPDPVAAFFRNVLGAALRAVEIENERRGWRGRVAGVDLVVTPAEMVDEAQNMLEGSPVIVRFGARDPWSFVERAREFGFDGGGNDQRVTLWGPELLVEIWRDESA